MFYVPLELPEFEVVKHHTHPTYHLVEVEKKSRQERCPCCGYYTSSIHDHRKRKVRDLVILNKPLYLLVHIFRFRCENYHEVFSQSFESIQSGKHQTNRFREHIYQLCHGTTIQDVAKKENIAYSTLERIYYSMAQQETSQRKPVETTIIGMDEIAVKRGHCYETVMIDLLTGQVIGLNHERTKESAASLLACSSLLSTEFIQVVVMDMWKPFHQAVLPQLPGVQIVLDKYHVVRKVTQALDQVRKAEQAKQPNMKKNMKKGRFALLKGQEKMNSNQHQQLDEYLDASETLAQAYFLKELFREFYRQTDPAQAESLLMNWIELAKSSSLKIFQDVAHTFLSWKEEILRYFQYGFTNARTEGTNYKIKNIKRRAYGYRNLERFRTRVILECTSKSISA